MALLPPALAPAPSLALAAALRLAPCVLALSVLALSALAPSAGAQEELRYPGGTLSISGEVKLADLDRDGLQDLVSFASASQVALRLARPDGTFGPPKKFTAGNTGIAVGDVNADGQPDIVTGKSLSGLRTLLGNGDGTFAPQVSSPATYVSTPAGLSLGDFNNDGKLDVVTASPLSFEQCDCVRLALGNGDGSFGAPLVVSMGYFIRATLVDDFSGDGNADIFVLAASEGLVPQLVVAPGDGRGGFGRNLITPSPPVDIGTPLLAGEGLPIPDHLVSVTASELPRGATGLLFVGLSTMFTPLLGGTLVPANDVALAITADAPLTDRWPKGLPPGMPVYFQAWFAGKGSGLPAGQVAATNALVTLSK